MLRTIKMALKFRQIFIPLFRIPICNTYTTSLCLLRKWIIASTKKIFPVGFFTVMQLQTLKRRLLTDST